MTDRGLNLMVQTPILLSFMPPLRSPATARQRIRRQTNQDRVLAYTLDLLPGNTPRRAPPKREPCRQARVAWDDQGCHGAGITATSAAALIIQLQTLREAQAGAITQVDDLHGTQPVAGDGTRLPRLHGITTSLPQCMRGEGGGMTVCYRSNN